MPTLLLLSVLWQLSWQQPQEPPGTKKLASWQVGLVICCTDLISWIQDGCCGQSIPRADSSLAPSQWETSLQSNSISHWLGANLESDLIPCKSDYGRWKSAVATRFLHTGILVDSVCNDITIFHGQFSFSGRYCNHGPVASCEVYFVSVKSDIYFIIAIMMLFAF